jgi:hypothetical protein
MLKLESNFQIVDEDQFCSHFWEKFNKYNKIGEDCNGSSVGVCWVSKNIEQSLIHENKLWNQLTIHLDLCVRIFCQNFFTLSNFLYDDASTL